MSQDHYVQFCSEDTIASIAGVWRNLAGPPGSHSFDIVEFVESTLKKRYARKGGLHISLFDRDFKQDDPAYVEFTPSTTLFIDRQIWTDAKNGDGYARFVIAHEIGHILLHNSAAKAFSIDPRLRIKFAENEYSAEWQANTFAGYFLLPDQLIERFDDVELLMVCCNVNREAARDRLAAWRKAHPRPVPGYTGDVCRRCSSFTMVANGVSLKCANCGVLVACVQLEHPA